MSTRTQHTTPAIQPASQSATSNQSGLHMADILLSDHSIFELGGIVLFANNPLTLMCQFFVLFCRSYRNQYQTKRLIFSNTVACMVHLMNQHIRFPWQGDHHFGEVAKMLRKQKIFFFFFSQESVMISEYCQMLNQSHREKVPIHEIAAEFEQIKS